MDLLTPLFSLDEHEDTLFLDSCCLVAVDEDVNSQSYFMVLSDCVSILRFEFAISVLTVPCDTWLQ